MICDTVVDVGVTGVVDSNRNDMIDVRTSDRYPLHRLKVCLRRVQYWSMAAGFQRCEIDIGLTHHDACTAPSICLSVCLSELLSTWVRDPRNLLG